MTARAFPAAGSCAPGDPGHSLRFYRDVPGLAVCRESAQQTIPGWFSSPARVCPGCPGHAAGPAGGAVMIWIRVRDVRGTRPAGCGRSTGHPGTCRARGLAEMWTEDRDGIRNVLVEVPPGLLLRRDRPS
jgi:hypothetical protein